MAKPSFLLNFRVTPEVAEAIARRAHTEDVSRSDLLRRAVVEYLEAHGEGRLRAHPLNREAPAGV